jgi:hypothetical protein
MRTVGTTVALSTGTLVRRRALCALTFQISDEGHVIAKGGEFCSLMSQEHLRARRKSGKCVIQAANFIEEDLTDVLLLRKRVICLSVVLSVHPIHRLDK